MFSGGPWKAVERESQHPASPRQKHPPGPGASDSARFLHSRSIFLATCPTPHTLHPPTDSDPFPSKSVSPSVVCNSVNSSSFPEGPKPESPGLPMTFPFPQPQIHTLPVPWSLHLPNLPPSSLYPAVALVLASQLAARTPTTPEVCTRWSGPAASTPGLPKPLPCLSFVPTPKERG